MYDIYGIGSALVDTEFSIPAQFLEKIGSIPGSMELIDEQHQIQLLEQLQTIGTVQSHDCGGSAANTVISTSRFGGRAFFACLTASDEDGHRYRTELQRAGVGSNHSLATSGATGKCLVMVTPDAERTMKTCLGVSANIAPQHIDTGALENASWLYLESYLIATQTGLETAREAISQAREAGTKIALSLSDPGLVAHHRESLTALLDSPVGIIFCNREEALALTRQSTLEAAAADLRQFSQLSALTLGAKGAWIVEPERILEIPARADKVVDTNGAGDMFAGAFMYALTQGHSNEKAGLFANCSAGTLVGCYGPRLSVEMHRKLLADFNFGNRYD